MKSNSPVLRIGTYKDPVSSVDNVFGGGSNRYVMIYLSAMHECGHPSNAR